MNNFYLKTVLFQLPVEYNDSWSKNTFTKQFLQNTEMCKPGSSSEIANLQLADESDDPDSIMEHLTVKNVPNKVKFKAIIKIRRFKV